MSNDSLSHEDGSLRDAEAEDQRIILNALSALEHSAGHLSATDVAVAEAQLAECEYRPLTKACISAATDLRTLVEERYGLATSEHAGEVKGEVITLNGDGVSRAEPTEAPG